jgi:type IV pilus assembly protein PilB
VPVSTEALSVVSQEIAERFRVFPISFDTRSKELVLAMADPLNLTAIEFIEQKTGYRIRPNAALPSQVDEFISTRYSTTLSQEVTEALREISTKDTEKVFDAGKVGFLREEKVAEIVRHILEFAVKSRASDIHIEPQESSTRVRYRIDGILQEKLTIPKALHEALISRIKILSGMKIDEKRLPQDGRFNFKSDMDDIDLRVSSMPISGGEKIVLRLLKKSGGVPALSELGLRGLALKNLQDAILRPHGIILICGPTGSGKTTTLYSIISKLNTAKQNIMTLEDPIEYKIQGVNQVQVNPAAGLTFANGLRAFLRQDPNIILVGEIRDSETMDLAIHASLTGHLVFSTLHTNDASGAIPRLLDMGAEPYLLASSLSAIVGQRVVRKIHDKCKVKYTPEEKIVAEVKSTLGPLWVNKEPSFYKGIGDDECGHTGYYGRVGVFEVLTLSEKIGRLILERSPATAVAREAFNEGMITMKQDGYLKALEGITSIEEVLRVAQD